MSTTVKQRILRGVGANALGQGVNVLVQLVGLPVFLAVWGVEKYGEWLVLSSLAAFLSMSDIGFASAAANEMTMRVGRDDRDGALVVYQSMWALLCGLGGLMLAVVLAVLWFTPAAGWLPLELTSATTAAAVLSVLAIHILVGQQSAVINAGFRCDGNYAIGQLLGTGGRLAEFLAQITAAITTGSMLAVALAGLAVRCVRLLVFAIVLKRYSPWLHHGIGHANKATIRELAAPAIAFMGMPLGHALGNQGMIQVVAAILGPAAVVVFTAHRTLTNVAVQFSNILANSAWPEFSKALGAGDRHTAKLLHRKACQWALWLGLLACLGIGLIATYLIPVWTGGKLQCNMTLLVVLLFCVLLRVFWWTSSVVPLSTNSHARMAVTYVLGTTASLVATAALAPSVGILAPAIGLAITDLLMISYVLPASMRAVDDNVQSFAKIIIIPPRLHFLTTKSKASQ